MPGRHHPCRTGAVLVAVGLTTLVACSSDAPDREVTVHAASSLTEVFAEIADRFEAGHDGVTVTLNFAASSELVTQLAEGAPADVFASADLASMDRAESLGLIDGRPVVFGTNHPGVAVPGGNPAGIASVADLARPDLVLVVCAPETPCGAYAGQLFELAGIAPEPDSYERNVKSVLAKVALGEADAGIVYATDVPQDGDVELVPDPITTRVTAPYPIAVTTGSDEPGSAQAFVDFVTGPTGRSILREAGFGTP